MMLFVHLNADVGRDLLPGCSAFVVSPLLLPASLGPYYCPSRGTWSFFIGWLAGGDFLVISRPSAPQSRDARRR